MNRGKMLAVIGAQWGSEGKGAAVSAIANEYQVHVRVGSPNAGHTIYWNGEKHVMQTIPCGWINPEARIVIGRGALINMGLLMKEIKHIEQYYPDFRRRLYIDAMAGVLDEKFHHAEGGVDGEMHKRIGSTGEGVGPARVARINRDPREFYHFKDIASDYGLNYTYDTHQLIASLQDKGENILLEGTQGSGLSLLHGAWPYVTSIDTNAAQILAECGIAPNRLTNVMLVARTYPIRVAGNSGPMGKEITWHDLSTRCGKNIEERTTVTKKIRRVSEWDELIFRNAVVLNGPTSLAITFADYIDPTLYGATTLEQLRESPLMMSFIINLEYKYNIPVSIIGTGPQTFIRTGWGE